jgi:hypothetical protein
LVRSGRQRQWLDRIDVGGHGKEVGKVSVKDLGRWLHRDSSIISRQYSAYPPAREPQLETRLEKPLNNKTKTKALYYEKLNLWRAVAIIVMPRRK